jgi:hypothetical protein
MFNQPIWYGIGTRTLLRPQLRDHVEWVFPVDAIGIKVTVQGKNTTELQLLGRSNKQGIGEVHRGIVILLHERP